MKLIGKASIRPVYFYSGKILGYLIWVSMILSLFNVIDLKMIQIKYADYLASFFLFIGLIFTIGSLINLGKSTRLGLPTEKTVFKDHGLYRISRNPMYLGFHLFTISSIFINLNIFILFIGIYSIVVYHFIIKSEEKFLENRFGQVYLDYKKTVRRYL